MSFKTRLQLKALFETGDIPTQTDFADLIESLFETVALTSTQTGGTNDFDATVDGLNAYGEEQVYIFSAASITANAGAVRFQAGALGYVTVKQADGSTNLAIGSLVAGRKYVFYYNGTNFVPQTMTETDPIFQAALDIDAAMTANSDSKVPSQKAVKTALAGKETAGAAAAAQSAAQSYADGLVVGLWDDRGNHDASTNLFPSSGGSGSAGAIKKGDIWTVSVAGTLGGHAVNIGDTVRALVDAPGSTDSNWAISENNIGYVPENAANKNAAGGYAGLGALYKLALMNQAGTFISLMTNTNTASRTYTLQDKTGTVSIKDDANTDTNYATPLDADKMSIWDTVNAVLKSVTWANIKATLKTYFDTLYPSGSGTSTGSNTGDNAANSNYQTLTVQQNAGTALKVFRQPITALQAQTLNSSPIPIADLPALPAGKKWAIVESSVKYFFGTTDYAWTTLFITCESIPSVPQANNVAPMGLLGADSDTSSFVGGVGGSKTNMIESDGMVISSDGDDASGDGTFIVYGAARIVTL